MIGGAGAGSYLCIHEEDQCCPLSVVLAIKCPELKYPRMMPLCRTTDNTEQAQSSQAAGASGQELLGSDKTNDKVIKVTLLGWTHMFDISHFETS